MARQYTKCISAGNHLGKLAAQVIIAAAATALPILLFGGALVPGVAVVVLSAIIAYCRWWLYDRLVCLGGDRCAVGWVSKVEPPSKKTGLDRFDTDYSFNLVLAPHLEGATQKAVEDDGLQGDLIKKHVPDDWDFEGMQEGQWANRPTAALHAEFEGGGVYNLMIACLAALPFAVAATVVCAIPVLGWIACAILGAIAAGIFLAGVIAGLTDTGDPNDVNPGLGEIHTNDPTGRGADILVVRGTWVYDSAHEGWNEIHPILHCQRIGTWGGSWSSTEFAPPSTMDSVKRWCEKVTQAEDPATTTAQLRPENQWEVHPVVDGCAGSAGSGTPPNLH
jgi:hypothetical protein